MLDIFLPDIADYGIEFETVRIIDNDGIEKEISGFYVREDIKIEGNGIVQCWGDLIIKQGATIETAGDITLCVHGSVIFLNDHQIKAGPLNDKTES